MDSSLCRDYTCLLNASLSRATADTPCMPCAHGTLPHSCCPPTTTFLPAFHPRLLCRILTYLRAYIPGRQVNIINCLSRTACRRPPFSGGVALLNQQTRRFMNAGTAAHRGWTYHRLTPISLAPCLPPYAFLPRHRVPYVSHLPALHTCFLFF